MNRMSVIPSVLLLMTFTACQPAKDPVIKDDHESAVQTDLIGYEEINWINENSIRLRSIDPTDEDFSDLEQLKKVIGNSRIVALGEQSHGDGATFHAKTRLIKFLHQEMGFDVLAFESGIFDCRRAWKRFKAGDAPYLSATTGLFQLWSMSTQVQPLFEYLGKMAGTKTPLELVGIDCQFSGAPSPPGVAEELKSFLDGLGGSIVEKEVWDNVESALGGLRLSGIRLFGQRYKIKDVERKALEELHSELERIGKKSRTSSMELAFWTQFSKNAMALADLSMVNVSDAGGRGRIRDGQMADNLVWLAREYYPDRKIVVWAASFHVMRNPQAIDVPGKPERTADYDEYQPLGHLAWKEMGDQIFSIGFITYEGTRQTLGKKKIAIDPAPKGSLEEYFKTAGFEYAFVPLRNINRNGEWIHKGVLSRPMASTPMRADWSRVFDAMFFIKTMYPSTRVSGSK